MRGTSGPQLADAQNTQIRTVSVLAGKQPMSPQNGGSRAPLSEFLTAARTEANWRVPSHVDVGGSPVSGRQQAPSLTDAPAVARELCVASLPCAIRSSGWEMTARWQR